MKKARPTVMWAIKHPLMPNRAYVLAESWELATVAAAEYWGVPWAKVAADCCDDGHHTVHRNVCGRCGGIYYGDDPLFCDRCRLKARHDQEEAQQAARHYWARKNMEWKERRA